MLNSIVERSAFGLRSKPRASIQEFTSCRLSYRSPPNIRRWIATSISCAVAEHVLTICQNSPHSTNRFFRKQGQFTCREVVFRDTFPCCATGRNVLLRRYNLGY